MFNMNQGPVPEHPNKLRPIATTHKEHVQLSRDKRTKSGHMLDVPVIVTSPVEDGIGSRIQFQTATEGNWVDPEKQDPKEKPNAGYDVPVPTAPLWMAIAVLIIVTGVSSLIELFSLRTSQNESVPVLRVSFSPLIPLLSQLVANNVRFLINSMNGLTDFTNGDLHHSWVALILLPIAGNVADHFMTVSHTFKDDLDLAISLAFGASIQMALLVIPFLVLLGWIMDKPLTLLFDPFQSIVLFVTSECLSCQMRVDGSDVFRLH